jgi:tripartite-type tricarboxylate transporter receptor subunit TctC
VSICVPKYEIKSIERVRNMHPYCTLIGRIWINPPIETVDAAEDVPACGLSNKYKGGGTMRIICVVLSILSFIALPNAASADDWPNRPIRWIVPFAAGGSTDVLARSIGEKLAVALKQPIVVENRPGGDTIVATAALAQAAPDGYTIGYIADPMPIHEAAGVKRPYNPLKDLAHVVQIAKVPLVFIANIKQVPQTRLTDIVSYAKAHPGWLSFASLGPGSVQELRFRQFLRSNSIEALIVPYRGGTLALGDVIAGHVKTTFRGGTSEADYAGGTVRAIAVATPTRVSGAPHIPTFAEEGYPALKFYSWYGLVVPAGTPQWIIARLNKEINRALATPEVKKVFAKMGMEAAGGASENLADFLRPEIELYQTIIKESGIVF